MKMNERSVRMNYLKRSWTKKGVPFSCGGDLQDRVTVGWVEEDIPDRDLVDNRGHPNLYL